MKAPHSKKMLLIFMAALMNIFCLAQDIKADSSYAVSFPHGKTAYIVSNQKTALAKRITDRVSVYMSTVIKKPVFVVSGIEKVPTNNPVVVLSVNAGSTRSALSTKSPEAYTIHTGTLQHHKAVVVNGETELGLKQGVQHFITKSRQLPNALAFPAMRVSESPWIPQREWTLCPWAPDLVRGIFNNPNADKRLNVWLYSDRQIEGYVDMFDAFGFSGCQLMETAANYSILGSPEAFRGRLKTFARSIKQNGQNVTLWVWAAQFNGYGWTDNSITYTPAKGFTAFNDPKVRAGFEKYYNGYQEMAPYTDMLITHFYDPGSLKNRADVFDYMRLLQNKFRSINPRVKFGVDFWASDSDSAYMKELIENGFSNELLLESGMPHLYPPGKREALHSEAKRLGIKIGVWGWHTVERESDQYPKMHVNAQVLSHFYKQIHDGVDKIHPVQYWSEMEAYHLSNIFSMYASARLLWSSWLLSPSTGNR